VSAGNVSLYKRIEFIYELNTAASLSTTSC